MQPRSRRVASAGALVLAFAARLAAAVVPPVPLWAPPLMVPVETAGSGLAPEASVRIAIDARGVVERVEVLAIRPPTAHDELFRATLVGTLSRWRYAPQLRAGAAEPTTLEWRVRFPARAEPAGAGSLAAAGPLAMGPPAFDAAERRARILALPERERLALLQAELATATSLLDPQRRRTASTDWVVAHADTDDAAVAGVVARNVEAIFRTLAARLLPGIELGPERSKLQVVVYRDRASYEELMRRTTLYEWSSGIYSPAGMIALHLEQYSDDAATHILLHEVTHAFLDRHVVRRGIALERWMDEGFADYIGNSRIRKGQLEPGRTLRGKVEMGRDGAMRVQTVGALQVDEARLALRRGRGLGVTELLGASPETFYGESRSLFYASSWLLVHYLRDGGAGWAEERFPRLVLYLAEGYPAAAVVRRLYGELGPLDAGFRDYVRRF